jgi:hypothetical protein
MLLRQEFMRWPKRKFHTVKESFEIAGKSELFSRTDHAGLLQNERCIAF